MKKVKRFAKRVLVTCVSLTMVLQTMAPVTNAVAQVLDEQAEIASYTGETGLQGKAADTNDSAADAGAADENGSTESPATDDATADSSGNAGQDDGNDIPANDGAGENAADADAAESSSDNAEQSDVNSEDDVEAQADAAYKITTAEDLKNLLAASGTTSASADVTVEGDKVTKVVATEMARTLIALSNTDPYIYQNAEIVLSASGAGVDLTGSAVFGKGTSSLTLEFKGLGSKECPFAGTITKKNITLKHTLFNGVDISASNANYQLTWKIGSIDGAGPSTTEPMFASYVKGSGGSLSVEVALLDSTDYSYATWSPLIGETDGDLSLNATYTGGSALKRISVQQDGNAGMLVNTVTSGTLTLVGFADKVGLEAVNVTSTNGSAGYLVGQVKGGAGLAVDYEVTAPEGTIQASNGSAGQNDAVTLKPGAGGVVGKAETGDGLGDSATVAIKKSVNLENLKIGGFIAGGFIGRAKNLTLTIDEGAKVAPALSVGQKNAADTDAEGEEAGALFGEVTFANAQAFDANNVSLNTEKGYTLNAKYFAGGLFGILGFPKNSYGDGGSPAVTVDGLTVKSSQWTSKAYDAGKGAGGIAGSLAWNGCRGKLTVNNTTVDLTTAQGGNVGGIVGTFGGSGILDTNKVTVNATLPAAGSIGNKFGGVVGKSNNDANVDQSVFVSDFTLSTKSGNGLSKGGGVIGAASQYMKIKLFGTTDLSGVTYDSAATAGQIIGAQDGALVFATGSGSDANWKFKRGNQVDLDDIGDYGEVIRLGGKLGDNFIELSEADGTLTLNNGTLLSQDTDGYAINNEKSFALLAISWQTRGVYSGVAGISNANWNGIRSKKITFTRTIDLSGTGITGLTRDNKNKGIDDFVGSIDGGGTVKLAIGEAYGMRGDTAINEGDETAGNGKIYRHNALGLFAYGNGSVSNVTIAGFIKFKACTQIYAGGYAATNSADVTIEKATFEPTITFSKTSGNNARNYAFCVGSIFGSIEDNVTVTFSTGSKVVASMQAPQSMGTNEGIDSYAYAGGAIGYVSESATPTINADGLTVSGNIKASTSWDSLPMGGFIGFIDQPNNNTSYKTVNLSNLTFQNFELNLKSNNAIGGLLGYSWAQTEVSIAGANAYAIKTDAVKIAANGSKSAGGLVCRAGGEWTLGDKAVDLSGLTIDNVAGNDSGRLGLLVCRGGRGSEEGLTAKRDVNSLYLESTANWADSYKLDGITLNISVDNFDEWVADTCEVSSENIFKSNVNGVVSLRTSGGASNALDMSGDSSKRNSYVNRTDYGREHRTDQYSRYYYNLDLCKVALGEKGDGYVISTPEGLLLWSVYNYMDSNIRDRYFGGCNSWSMSGDFDMEGYSYYPIDYYDKDMYISNSTFRFCNTQIEAEESGNKLTSADSQHKGMHCGIFRNVTASSKNRTLTVNNVTFAGTIGKLDGSSGVLVCNQVAGSISGSTAYVYTVNIAGCKLDGIEITGFKNNQIDYAPLLIGNTSSATALEVSEVALVDNSYKGGTAVASSLIGNVGNKDASRVTVNFSKIALPSKTNDKIFSKATLLNAFSYSDAGSATYNFTKEDDANKKVTYGKEIDKTGDNSQYYNEQLWYYGVAHEDANRVQDGEGTTAVRADRDAFSSYLPYVAYQYDPNNKNYEIKVNHQVTDIVVGCGTYGHPYEITTAEQFNKVAEAVNMGTFSDGMKVRVVADQNSLCTETAAGEGANDFEVTLSNGSFTGTKPDGTTASISTDTMRSYFQSAYYSIKSDITLTDFAGLGSGTECAFRGVIVGDGGSITIDRTSSAPTSYGLIRYSYGSVVKDLKIVYSGAKNSIAYDNAGTITKSAKDQNGKDVYSYIPKSFFGGVIGCILGGDNILDGVTIEGDGFSVGGDSSSLVPIGGYVGVIAGGGVIFRQTEGDKSTLNNWHQKTENLSAYDNPYLGRMLDGYAFSEGCTVNNGDKDSNYKINEIIPSGSSASTDDIASSDFSCAGVTGPITSKTSTIETTVEINSAQGLLVLSGIINSGAAAGATGGDEETQKGTRAYLGKTKTSVEGYSFGNEKFGKVRNARYDSVGKVTDANSDELKTALDDDLKAPGAAEYVWPSQENIGQYNSAVTASNTPYLVTAYANPATAFLCASVSAYYSAYVSQSVTCAVVFEFAPGGTFDMTGYGSGYLGLSARYVTNAALQGSGSDNGVKRTYSVNPQVTSIVGNNSVLKVYKNEKEYAEDDFHTLGVGGLFSTAGFITPASNFDASTYKVISGITIADSFISLSYYNADSLNGVTLSSANSTQNQRLRSIVGVGGIAGVLAPESTEYKGGQIEDVTITASSKGGTKIKSPATAGSLFGMAAYAVRATDEGNITKGVFAYADGGTSGTDIKAMTMRLKDCSYKNIDVEADRWAGGFFGNLTTINTDSGFYVTKDNLIVAKDSTIHSNGKYLDMLWEQNNTYAGGLVGYAKSKFQINSFSGIESKTLVMEDVEITNDCTNWNGAATGGLIGRYESPTNCNINDVVIRSSDASNREIIGKSKTNTSTVNNVGGLIGRADYNSPTFNFSNCAIENMNIYGSNYAGGLIGRYDNSINLTVDGACVRNSEVNSNYSGGLIGFSNNDSSQVFIKNSKLASTTFGGAYTAAIAGETKAEQHWSNLLLDGNIYSKIANQGVLIGKALDCKGAYIAGLDIRLTDSQKTRSDLPTAYFYNAPEDFSSKSYISFANYTDASWNEDDNSKTLAQSTAADPYSNMVPVSAVQLNTGNSTIDGYLFGDGMNPQLANPDAGDGAESIIRDVNRLDADSQSGKFVYTRFVKDNYPITSSNISSIATENNKTYSKDFPVLLVASGQDSVIESYLNTVTNGGYSGAKTCNTGVNQGDNARVSATVTPYKYDGNGSLVPDDSGRRASVDVRDSGTKDMKFVVTSGYDNTLERVSLITVTFRASDGQTQMVYVPVVVRRMVQVDFTATMVNDTDFNKADYAGLGANAHVLAAYGDTVTALLTYTYNSELGDYKEYDWNGHLSAGGNMGPVDKTLKFGSATGTEGNYPPGTQLTLVDCASKNKMYYYEVPTGSATNPGKSVDSVKLSSFTDKNGKHYEPAWMSDTMGVTAEFNTSGNWIECEKGQATASGKLEGVTKYFRVVDSSKDTDPSKYCMLTVDSEVKSPTENFYLVVRFPASTDEKGLNGYLDSTVELTVPSRMNKKLRAEDKSEGGTGWRDSQDNTASTYNILSGYSQSLVDHDSDGVDMLHQNTSDYSFGDHRINVSDTITFAENQVANPSDKLYFQLDASLVLHSYSKAQGESAAGATGFPVGSSGSVAFYVHDGDTYYVWQNDTWTPSSQQTPAIAYNWPYDGTGDGGEMKLTLGTSANEGDAVSLHGLRDSHKSIVIDVVMDVHMSDAAHSAGIAASTIRAGEDRPSEYTKLQYRGVLTTNNARFASSGSVESRMGNHGFYRSGSGSSTIEFVADVPSQLGINIDDLSQADGTIAATGTYDLGNLNGSADVIANATEIAYTLTLQKRTGTDADGNGIYDDVNIGNFLSVTSAGVDGILGARSGAGQSSFVWTDVKGANGFNTLASGSRSFVLPLTIKVDTTKDAHTYANYRLVLKAELKSNGQTYTPENTSDYITYALTRVSLKGIK